MVQTRKRSAPESPLEARSGSHARQALQDLTNSGRGPNSAGDTASGEDDAGGSGGSSSRRSSGGEPPGSGRSASPAASSEVGDYEEPTLHNFFDGGPYVFGDRPDVFPNDQSEVTAMQQRWFQEVENADAQHVGISSFLMNLDGQPDDTVGEQIKAYTGKYGAQTQEVLERRRTELIDKLVALRSAIIARGEEGPRLTTWFDRIYGAMDVVEKWAALCCTMSSVLTRSAMRACGPGPRDQHGKPKESADLQLQRLVRSYMQARGWMIEQHPATQGIAVYERSVATAADGTVTVTPHYHLVRGEQRPGHDDYIDGQRLFAIVYNKPALGGEMQELCNDPAKGQKAIAILAQHYADTRVPTCRRTLFSFKNGERGAFTPDRHRLTDAQGASSYQLLTPAASVQAPWTSATAGGTGTTRRCRATVPGASSGRPPTTTSTSPPSSCVVAGTSTSPATTTTRTGGPTSGRRWTRSSTTRACRRTPGGCSTRWSAGACSTSTRPANTRRGPTVRP